MGEFREEKRMEGNREKKDGRIQRKEGWKDTEKIKMEGYREESYKRKESRKVRRRI